MKIRDDTQLYVMNAPIHEAGGSCDLLKPDEMNH